MKFLKFISFIFLVSTSLFSRSIEDIQNSGEMIIAVYEDFPPYSFIEKGEAKGIDIEVGKRLAQSLGVKPKWYFSGSDENLEDDLRNLIWKGNIVHKTKADVMLRVPYDYDFIRQVDKSTGGLSNDLVVIKGPYHAEKWVILTNKKRIEKINTLGIFAYHKVGVEIDTLPDLHLSGVNRGLLRKNIVHYTNIQKAVEEFKNEKIDAIAGLKSQLEYLLEYQKNRDKYYMTDDITGMKSIWDIATAVRTDFRALSYHIDEQIRQMYETKEIEKIFNNYGIKYIKPISITH